MISIHLQDSEQKVKSFPAQIANQMESSLASLAVAPYFRYYYLCLLLPLSSISRGI